MNKDILHSKSGDDVKSINLLQRNHLQIVLQLDKYKHIWSRYVQNKLALQKQREELNYIVIWLQNGNN